MAASAIIARLQANLKGVLPLMRFDEAGFSQIETSWAGARFSFVAAFICLPIYLLMQAAEAPDEIAAGFFRSFGTSLIIYALQWCLLPLLVFYLCRAWQKLDTYPRFLSAYNWMTVWQSLIYAVSVGGFTIGLIPLALMNTLSLVLLIYLFAVEGFIAQRGLGISIMGAVGIVIADLFLVWQLGQLRAFLLQ